MGPAGDRYDAIGRSYARTRVEDPHIARTIHRCLGDAPTVLNVGAGTGSYEPPDRSVVAVEPSGEMIRQRSSGSAPALRCRAEALPFRTAAFAASMAVLTVHHWSDPASGLREMRRVSSIQVVLWFEPLRDRTFWALDYFPEALDLVTESDAPGAELLGRTLDVRRTETVLVPRDCRDGFSTAYWARPEAYLDTEVQAGMSMLALLSPAVRTRGTRELGADLASGAWDERYGHLRRQPTFDGGLRVAVAG